MVSSTTPVAEARSERPPRPAVRTPRRHGTLWAATFLAVVVLGTAAWWVTHSQIFEVRGIRVEGAHHLSAEEVRALAALGPHPNLLWLQSGVVESRLERDPWVLSATVHRSLPSTLTIEVRERRPVGLVPAPDGGAVLVAGDAVVLGPAGAGTKLPRLAVPVVRGAEGTRVRGARAELAVAASLSPRVARAVDRISRTSPASIVLQLHDGTVVYFGDQAEAEAKARSLDAILLWAGRNGVRAQYVDVRAPDAPALLPVGASTSVRPQGSPSP